jgi:hypothetical protein
MGLMQLFIRDCDGPLVPAVWQCCCFDGHTMHVEAVGGMSTSIDARRLAGAFGKLPRMAWAEYQEFRVARDRTGCGDGVLELVVPHRLISIVAIRHHRRIHVLHQARTNETAPDSESVPRPRRQLVRRERHTRMALPIALVSRTAYSPSSRGAHQRERLSPALSRKQPSSVVGLGEPPPSAPKPVEGGTDGHEALGLPRGTHHRLQR